MERGRSPRSEHLSHSCSYHPVKTLSLDPHQTRQQQLLQETLNELDKRRKVGGRQREWATENGENEGCGRPGLLALAALSLPPQLGGGGRS